MVNQNSAITPDKTEERKNSHRSRSSADCARSHFEIKVAGQLDEHWSEWLGNLSMSHDAQGNTLLTGMIPDQAALHGILTNIRDLGLVLISLNQVDVKMERKGCYENSK